MFRDFRQLVIGNVNRDPDQRSNLVAIRTRTPAHPNPAFQAIGAALKGRMLNGIITDEMTAEYLLKS